MDIIASMGILFTHTSQKIEIKMIISIEVDTA